MFIILISLRLCNFQKISFIHAFDRYLSIIHIQFGHKFLNVFTVPGRYLFGHELLIPKLFSCPHVNGIHTFDHPFNHFLIVSLFLSNHSLIHSFINLTLKSLIHSVTCSSFTYSSFSQYLPFTLIQSFFLSFSP
jgi:hypothetical protein